MTMRPIIPRMSFDLTLAKAQLLADHGEADAGLAFSARSWYATRSIPPSSTTAR